MSIRPTTLLDHVVWADTQAYGALASLSPGSAEHTQAVRIYTHLAAAAHIWLARLEGRRPEHAVWPTALSLAEAHALAEASLAGLRVVAAAAEGTSAPATGLSRIVAYRTSTGQPLQNSVADILTHVALHGSYHRGQLALLTRQGGGTPANATDFVVFAHGTDADASPLPPSSAG